VDHICGRSINNTHKLFFYLKRLECYNDTQMKTNDITKLITVLKSDNVQYRNKISYTVDYFVACFSRGCSDLVVQYCHTLTVKLTPYLLGIGKSLRFMNEKNCYVTQGRSRSLKTAPID